MRVFSIETSSKICSVAILEDKNLIKKIELNNGLTHSETLMPLIKQILEETNLTLSQMDLFVCDIGPGSFTGIRIGVATVKAFSDSLSIPAIGISSLEGLAYSTNRDGIICSMIDCKNDNCYYAVYQLENGQYTLLESPKADSIENCLTFLNYKYTNSTITFVGDACLCYKNMIKTSSSRFFIANEEISHNIDNHHSEVSTDYADVYALGIAGINKYTQLGEDKNLLPLYLKKPQAQRQLEGKNMVIVNMKMSDLENIEMSDFDDFWNMDILRDELTSNTSQFICATYENKIVGFAGIKIILDEADMMNIAVRKDYRRQGIATLLLNHILTICQEKGIKTIHLEVNEENFSAISLYQKIGFTECGRRKQYYDNQYDAILMKK